MNDKHAPAIVEWFYRIAAVLGMAVLFVLCMILMLRAMHPPPAPTFPVSIGSR